MRRPPVFVAVLIVAAVASIGVVMDQVRPSAATDRPPPVRAGSATSGAWYCAAGNTQGSDTLRVVAASPPAPQSRPSVVRIDQFREGMLTSVGDDTQVFPNSSFSRTVSPHDDDLGVAARWWERPAAITRVWEVGGAGPAGYVTGPCEPAPSQRWIVPGVATAGGAQAQLHLANPFDSDASVSVTFATPEGELAPKRLENVVVGKRSVRTVDLNRHAPERPDLGAIVQVRAGRVIAEATQTFNAAIGGIDGRSLVKAARVPAETWTIPWFEDREGSVSSWLWITNVEERAASVSLSLHTTDGAVAPENIEEITVDPNQVRRVDLRGLLEGTSGALTVRSDNGVPVTASVATEYSSPPEARTGVAVQLGATQTDGTWVLSGGPTSGRQVYIHLVNPTGEAASADISLWSATGVLRPAALQGVQVAPGGVARLDVGTLLAEADHFSAFVETSAGQLVASLHAMNAEGPRRLVATLGIPAGIWEGGEIVPPVEYEPGITQRAGTSLGPRPTPTDAATPSGDGTGDDSSGG